MIVSSITADVIDISLRGSVCLEIKTDPYRQTVQSHASFILAAYVMPSMYIRRPIIMNNATAVITHACAQHLTWVEAVS